MIEYSDINVTQTRKFNYFYLIFRQTMTGKLEDIPSLDSLLQSAKTLFKEKFGREATHGAAAPGRVNLIGKILNSDFNIF